MLNAAVMDHVRHLFEAGHVGFVDFDADPVRFQILDNASRFGAGRAAAADQDEVSCSLFDEPLRHSEAEAAHIGARAGTESVRSRSARQRPDRWRRVRVGEMNPWAPARVVRVRRRRAPPCRCAWPATRVEMRRKPGKLKKSRPAADRFHLCPEAPQCRAASASSARAADETLAPGRWRGMTDSF